MTKEISLSTEQQNQRLLKKLSLSVLLAVLTMFFCVYVADGLFGINGFKRMEGVDGMTATYAETENRTGAVIFAVFLIALPLLFSRWIQWTHTLVNYAIYPAAWYILDVIFGKHPGHYLLSENMGMFSGFDKVTKPLFMTWVFFVAHSLVFLAVYCIRKVRQKMKKA